MSISYGFEMKGPLVLERVVSLPTWTSSDEGRLVYNLADKELYMGTNTQWEKKESDGYGATDTVFANNDPLVAGTAYFINTTSSSLTGILPETPSIGQKVTIFDTAGQFRTNPFYVNGNGKNINGSSTLTLNVKDSIVDLTYNGTQWLANFGGSGSATGSSSGGIGNIVNVTANYTASDGDFVFVEAETGAVTITLPSVGLGNGSFVTVYDEKGAFSNEPCIVNGGGNNILGASTMKIKTNYAKVDFIWDAYDGEWKSCFSTGKLNDSINVIDISSAYNAEVGDFILADTTAGPFSITLPTSGSLTDKAKITLFDQTGNFGTYSCSIIPSDGTIDGDSILTCDIPGLKVDLIWDAENLEWKVDFGGSVLASTSSSSSSYDNWLVKTSSFLAEIKKKYIVDTTTGIITATLPSTVNNGEGIRFTEGGDYTVNKLIIDPNGNTIEGTSGNMDVDTANMSFELVFYNDNWILA